MRKPKTGFAACSDLAASRVERVILSISSRSFWTRGASWPLVARREKSSSRRPF
ncbi:hypothetical protein P3T18_006306 [Paraburkholderia sp. GAS199]